MSERTAAAGSDSSGRPAAARALGNSEVMAIVAVSNDLHDLRRRLGAITVGFTYEGEPVTADDLQTAGAMTVILKETLKPNLIQTLEGQACFMHCGPFANIAHGNNSLVADKVGLKLGDICVTGCLGDPDCDYLDEPCKIGICNIGVCEQYDGNDGADCVTGHVCDNRKCVTLPAPETDAACVLGRRPLHAETGLLALLVLVGLRRRSLRAARTSRRSAA